MKAATFLAGVTIIAGASCTRPADKPVFNAARAVDLIRAGEVDGNADWKSGDPGKVVADFAPDATLMIPYQAPVSGLEAIRAEVAKTMDDPAFSLSFNSEKVMVSTSGDLAVSRGGFTITATDPTTKAVTTSTGSFVSLYKPQPDGTWKTVWDIATPGPTRTSAATK